jgi:hypothetical protein
MNNDFENNIESIYEFMAGQCKTAGEFFDALFNHKVSIDQLHKLLGLDTKFPQILEPKEFSQHSGTPIYSGAYNAREKIADKILRGEFRKYRESDFISFGIGYYFSKDYRIANAYGRPISAKLSEDANITNEASFLKLFRGNCASDFMEIVSTKLSALRPFLEKKKTVVSTLSGAHRGTPVRLYASLAQLHGIDGLSCEKLDEMCIFNRNVLVMTEDPVVTKPL